VIYDFSGLLAASSFSHTTATKHADETSYHRSN